MVVVTLDVVDGTVALPGKVAGAIDGDGAVVVEDVVDDDVVVVDAGAVADFALVDAGLGKVSANASCATTCPDKVKPINNALTAVVIRA
ncbi:MAG: hypothetical protein K2Q32_05110 [Alphaproteobacteria bacterium]|nr:hypothetical protein [Alphaproteobacteria bacterium]